MYVTTTTRLVNIVSGVYAPVLAKHSKSFSLIDCISVGVDRIQRNFEPNKLSLASRSHSEPHEWHRQWLVNAGRQGGPISKLVSGASVRIAEQ